MKAIVSHIEYSPSKEVTFVRCKPEDNFTFKEGQFMMVASDHIHEWLGKPLKKPYSIATTNQELQEKGSIGFVVKKVREWFMSEYLTDTIQVGDVLHLQWPVGHMIDTWANNAYLLASVGSGLSPMVSLYNHIVASNPTAKIANLFWERFHAHVLPSVEETFSLSSDNVHNQLFLSKEENLPKNYTQWHIQNGLESALAFLNTKEISVFICGKPEMVDDFRSQLTAYWVDPKNIKFEKY